MICDKLQECVEDQFSKKSAVICRNSQRNCIKSSDSRVLVKCEERRKKYTLENTEKEHIIVYQMDGGVIVNDKTVPAGISKCDYLFMIGGIQRKAILIELKGLDIRHAIEQIKKTCDLYNDSFRECSKVYARIITTAVPRIQATPEYRNLNSIIQKKYKGNVKIAARELKEKDNELDKI